ncbi:hypothetical protein [Arthrobacter sp. NEB 688]|uniref:hypothetical protein n=1 Tax=Arthrobacter sp. NEB 688 TaxID=904039 RepID=UPI0015664648|nr:hypothetical protein [Arthrobacter sp. NEB 688]QKE84391.1 hypothetical protein HL663_10900 [Arthrobacter sp. NEB 688]
MPWRRRRTPHASASATPTPLLTGVTRRGLAAKLERPDTSAGIPEACWMRAMTFETLLRNEKFVSKLRTPAVGRLSLARPEAVRRADGKVTVGATESMRQ